jgi:hypothetical protein
MSARALVLALGFIAAGLLITSTPGWTAGGAAGGAAGAAAGAAGAAAGAAGAAASVQQEQRLVLAAQRQREPLVRRAPQQRV